MKKLIRITAWINRLLVSFEKLGIINTIKIFVLARFAGKKQTISLPGKHLFNFESEHDRGVISHFYTESYFIEDVKDQPITRIIDAGANIGDETARFCIHYPDAKIVAVEASDRNFVLLQENFNGVENVELVKGAVWPVKANLKIISGNAMEAFKVIEMEGPKGSISAWSIQDILDKMGWDKVDILKLDIEGAEYELFTRDYEKWVNKVNAFIFEVPDNDRAGTTQEIYRALNQHSYNTSICGECLVLIRSDLPWKLRKVVGFNN